VAPIGQEVILRGSVFDPGGMPRPGAPVEWILTQDSVGAIVDAWGLQSRRLFVGLLDHRRRSGLRGCNDYVLSRTATRCDTVRPCRSGGAALQISRGETWVSVTSGAEGASYVALVATDLPPGEQRQQIATIFWIDGRWAFPPPVVSQGRPATLTTRLVRSSDGSPISGWIVRYETAGGPPASLDAEGNRVVDVISSGGSAAVTVSPQGTAAGTTRILVRIIRPAVRPGEPARLIVGEALTSVRWGSGSCGTPAPALPPLQAEPNVPSLGPPPVSAPPVATPELVPAEPAPAEPAADPPIAEPAREPAEPPATTRLQVRVQGPEEVSLTTRLRYRISVGNAGDVAARNVVISNPVPYGLQFVASQPAPADAGSPSLEWQVAELPAGQSATIDVEYRPLEPLVVQNNVFVRAANAPAVDDGTTTRIVDRPLRVRILDPVPSPVEVGQEVNFGIEVSNRGTRPLTGVRVVDRFEAGLQALVEARERQIERDLGTLQPGETKTFGISFRAERVGRQRHWIEVTCAEGPSAADQSSVLVVARPDFEVGMVGPAQIEAGQTQTYRLVVRNTGEATLTRITVRYDYGADLVPAEAPTGFQQSGTTLFWTGDPYSNPPGQPLTLEPGGSFSWQLILKANRVSPRACNQVTVTASGEDRQAELCVEIQPGSEPAPRVPPGALNRPDGSAQQPRGSIRLAVDSLYETRRVSESVEYIVSLHNQHTISDRDAALTLRLSDGMEFLPLHGPTRVLEQSDQGRTLSLAPVREIRPGETIQFRVSSRATQPGPATLRAELRSRRLPVPVTAEQTTTVYP
jgi:uncharacterized repeat protein (TIGR01451 family)